MTDHYAVLGHPIAHSKSPTIHRCFAEQTKQDMCYEAIELPLDEFLTGVEALHQQGYRGINVTIPFKFDAFSVCEALSDRAQFAGAVNTLIRTETGWRGDNTDGAGLVADLNRLLGSLSGKQVLLLGAGGASSGVVKPLLDAGVDHLTIANRSVDKAVALAERTRHHRVNGCGFDVVPDQSYHVVINATSASLAGDLPPMKSAWFDAQTLAYDMMYAAQPTVFMQAATHHGAGMVQDGLGMLIEQAAEAFFLWRGIRPQTDAVRAQW